MVVDIDISKNNLIYIGVSFLIGLLVGVGCTLFLVPRPDCECKDQIEVVENFPNEDSENVKAQENHNDDNITSNSIEVSLPVSQCSIVVDIAGAVSKPGVYCLEEGSNMVDAVEHAKGFVEGVAQKYVSMSMNLASTLEDHQKIYIPFEDDVYCEVKSLQFIDAPTNTSNTTNNGNSDVTDSEVCININTATLEQLTSLNGIGESTAQKIIDGRPYSETTDLLNVSGIGEATFEKFKNDICVF